MTAAPTPSAAVEMPQLLQTEVLAAAGQPAGAAAGHDPIEPAQQPHVKLLPKLEPSSSNLSKHGGAEEGASASSEASEPPPGHEPPPPPRLRPRRGFWTTLLRYVGPGFLMSMAYIDPGNMAADINLGLAAGYQLGWVTLWATGMGFVVQMLAAKLGIATERHLAEHCRACYPPVPRILLWAVIELAILACDMIEVIGGAAALYTLSSGAVPLWAGVLITVVSAFLTLLLERFGMRLLETALVSSILVMTGVFGFMFFSTGVPYGQVAKGLAVPYLSVSTIPYVVGAVGQIIVPHNLYLHSALVRSRIELVARPSVGEALRFMRIESAFALLLGLAINIFVTSVFAHAFYGVHEVQDVGLVNAGALLAGQYGGYMRYIWGVGLLAAANASTVTSTYAGQVVMTGFLRLRVSAFWRTTAVRLFTLGPTLLVAILLGSNGNSFSSVTNWLNIMQSLVLPFAIIPLLLFTSSKAVMGAHVNPRWVVATMSLVVAFLIAMNGYLAVSFALDQLPRTAWAFAVFGVGCALYCTFMAYLLLGPSRCGRWAGRAKALAARLRPALLPAGQAPAPGGDVATPAASVETTAGVSAAESGRLDSQLDGSRGHAPCPPGSRQA